MAHEFSSGQYYIEHRDRLPHAVFGRIVRTRTSDRESPAPPLSGFVCDRTPFAKGHIMALELGGPDIAENIVPQYGMWQGVGEWRIMETTVAENFNGHFFVAWLYYNFASRDYAGQHARCSKGEVFDWNHADIPSRIEVRVLDAHSGNSLVARLASLLSARVADEAAFSALLETIRRLPEMPPVSFAESFFQYEMPEIDRKYWCGQHTFAILQGWWTDYSSRPAPAPAPVVATGRVTRSAAHAGAAAAPAPVLMDDLRFSYTGADAVRQALRRERRFDGAPMWEDAFLNQTVTPAFCVDSRFKNLPKATWTQLRKTQDKFPYSPPNRGDS